MTNVSKNVREDPGRGAMDGAGGTDVCTRLPILVRWLSEKSVTKRTKALKLYMSFI